MFNQHFVKPGLTTPRFGKLFNNLFQNRNRGDYRDLARFDETTVRPWLEEVPRFLSEMEKLAASPTTGESARPDA